MRMYHVDTEQERTSGEYTSGTMMNLRTQDSLSRMHDLLAIEQ
jgi:hypothetical protein